LGAFDVPKMKMLDQQKRILKALEEQDWEVVETHDSNLEWWADQIWLLISKRKSPDYKILLTFVVDPQWDGPRNKGQGVWAVTASLNQPQQWSAVTLSLGRGWQKQLPPFLSSLSNLHS
jgi:hypothetical protein